MAMWLCFVRSDVEPQSSTNSPHSSGYINSTGVSVGDPSSSRLASVPSEMQFRRSASGSLQLSGLVSFRQRVSKGVLHFRSGVESNQELELSHLALSRSLREECLGVSSFLHGVCRKTRSLKMESCWGKASDRKAQGLSQILLGVVRR